MATIRIKRGSTTPAYTSLAQGEPAVNTTLNTLFIRTGTAGNSADVKLIGAEIEAQTAANGFSAINWGSASDSKLATQNAIETRFMPKAGGTFTGAVSFGQGSTAAGEIRLLEDTDDGSNYSAFRGSARSANITYVMPTTDPTSGQVLSASAPSTNVSTLSWVDAGAASTVTVTNDDTTTTLYPIFSTATSGSVSPKIDSDGMTYDAANDQLNGVNIKASNLLILGDTVDYDIQDFPANTILSGVFSTSTFNFIPINGDFTTYNFVVHAGETQNNTINFGTGDLVSSTKTINIGTGGGSSTTTAINIGSTAGTSTTTVNNNLTVTGDVAVNGGDITTTSTGTVTVFNTNATTVNLGGAATTMAIGNTATAAQTVNMFTASTGASTYNFATGATGAATTKTVNLGTGGAASSTTNVNIGSSNGGTTTVNSATLVGAASTQAVFNTTATTVNAFGAATAITMGDSTAATTTIRGGTLVGNTTTQKVFATTATTVNAFDAATTITIGSDATAAQTVNMFASSTGASTYNFATGGTTTGLTKTLNIGTGGGANSTTNINIGSSVNGQTNINSQTLALASETGTTTLLVNRECFPESGIVAGESTRFQVLAGTGDNADDADIIRISAGVGGFENTDAFTRMTIGNTLIARYDIAPTSSYFEEYEEGYDCIVNFAYGALNSSTARKVVNIATGHSDSGGTVVAIGASASTSNITLNGSTTITGNLTVNGTTTTMNSSTITVDDKNIEMGSVIVKSNMQGTVNSANAVVTFTGTSTTEGLLPGQTLTKTAGTGAFGTGATILSVDSLTQVTMSANAQTTGTVTFSSSGATDASANGGGLTLKGTTDKTIIWDSANSNWTASEHWNIASTKVYKINNTQVLSASALGSGVTTSSLTTVGALSSGSITTGFTQITAANMVGLAALDIDGGTATTTIVGSDLLIVDDGANGTNRYVTVDNLFGSSSTATIDGGTYP